jgi:hypothetical protein
MLLTLAAAQGHAQAKQSLDAVAGQMPPGQIERAQAAARAWWVGQPLPRVAP